MKHLLLAFLLFSFPVRSLGQKISFVDSSNKWRVYTFGVDVVYGPYLEKYRNDTVVSSITYHQLFNSKALIREDTSARKVFAIEHGDTSFAEQLLYDYTLHLGDTFKCRIAVHHVSSIDSVLISGIWHKAWYFVQDSCFGCSTGFIAFNYWVVEGIGCLNEPVLPLSPLYFESGPGISCFINNGIAPPLSHKVGSFFDNSSSCDATFGVSVKDMAGSAEIIKLYPNPAGDELTINTSALAFQSFSITNAMGQPLIQREMTESVEKVNVRALPAGIYYVVLRSADGSVVRKFVKW